jgi:hypothetical protein
MKKELLLLFMIVSGFISKAQTIFNYTGAVQTYTVPVGVSTISVDVAGAKGGQKDATYIGGKGGRVQALVPVTPGEVLQVFVGGAGATASTVASGGYNGGGGITHHAGSSVTGTGGGSSDIRRSPYGIADRIIVAGGGGGGGYQNMGGHGGGLTAVDGGFYPSFPSSGGKAGTPSAGGAAGASSTYCNGFNSAGALFQGGTGDGDGAGGGGGGGGYYGGGGGCFAAGGGGSSYTTPSATNVSHTQGYQNGDGIVKISIPLTAAASFTPILCAGGTSTVTVSAAGGTTPYSGTGNFTVTAGTYTYTVTDANSFTSSTTITVTEPAALTASLSSKTNISCNAGSNGAASISATGGTPAYTYDWTPGNPTGDGTAAVTGLTAGT